MAITKLEDNNEIVFVLEGRLNSGNAKEFEDAVKSIPADTKKVIIDISGLEYISSAGLRIILIAQQLMEGIGELLIKSPQEAVAEIFEVTGFSEFLTIVD